MKNSQKGFIAPLLIAIIAVLVIAGGIYLYNKPQGQTTGYVVATSTQSETAISQKGYYEDHDYSTNPDGSVGKLLDVVFVSYQSDNTRIIIPQDVGIKIDTYLRASVTGSKKISGETLSAGLIVTNPNNNRQVYLSTSDNALGSADCKSVESLYQYNLDTNVLKNIFTTTEQLNGAYNCKQLRLIGIQGNHLLMNKASSDDSPGPCYSPLLVDSVGALNSPQLFSLDITNPGKGLTNYVPSAATINTELKNQQTCQANL